MNLSIVIPTYNRSDSLFALLNSLESQKDVNIEIVVINQNPQGYFPEGVFDCFKQLSIIELVTPNVSAARNLGFNKSKWDIVLFLDDDLLPEDDFCFLACQIFENFKFIDCFVPNVFTDNSDSTELLKRKNIKYSPTLPNLYLIRDSISACVLFRRSAFLKFGGFNPYHFDFARTGEDQEFFLRMNRLGGCLWLVNSIKIYHDENVIGGCELRTQSYWITRKKCLRGIVMRMYFQRNSGGLFLTDYLEVLRFILVNRSILKMKLSDVRKNMTLFFEVIRESREYISDKGWSVIQRINYLDLEY